MYSTSLCINFFITSLSLKDNDVCFVTRCFHERFQIVWPDVVVRDLNVVSLLFQNSFALAVLIQVK